VVKGRALRAEYEMDSDTVTMIGEAILIQGEDTFRSDRIIYDRAKAVVKAGASAQGKKRVKISIRPKKSQKDQQ
jgi:lipopolysaccharide export system protein LptA